MNCSKETLKGILQQAKRDCPYQVHSDQMVLGTVRQAAGPRERSPKVVKTKLVQGGHQAPVHSGQMVHVMAGQEAEPHERCPKMLKGALYNCSASRWRPQKVDKRMVLEYTHGLFIT
jgi:hypothetical protein